MCNTSVIYHHWWTATAAGAICSGGRKRPDRVVRRSRRQRFPVAAFSGGGVMAKGIPAKRPRPPLGRRPSPQPTDHSPLTTDHCPLSTNRRRGADVFGGGFTGRAYQGGLIRAGLSGRAYQGGLIRAGLSGRAYQGGAACPCGARCAPPPRLERVESAILSPPRAILSQGEESDGSLRRCLALPGKGRCRCARSTLFALRVKALQSSAPYFGVSRKNRVSVRFAHQETSPGAPGNGETSFSPQGSESFPHAVCSTFSQ